MSEGEFRRLDVRMLLVHPVQEAVRFFPALAAVFITGRTSGRSPWWDLGALVVVVLLGMSRWFTTRYRISGGQIELRTGLLNRKLLATPADRVRTVDVTAPIWHRLLGLTRVEIGTASGTHSDRIVLDVKGGTLDIDALQLAKLLKQLDVTPDAIAQWTLAGRIDLAGTLSPLDLGGPVRLRTQDFLVTADAWHQRPATRIMGIPRGRVEGRVTVTPEGLGFRDLDVTMPNSTAHVDLLLGFEDYIEVTGHSTQMDLPDVTPLTTLLLGGRGSWRAGGRPAGRPGSPCCSARAWCRGPRPGTA